MDDPASCIEEQRKDRRSNQGGFDARQGGVVGLSVKPLVKSVGMLAKKEGRVIFRGNKPSVNLFGEGGICQGK